jgi:hypothetical protein
MDKNPQEKSLVVGLRLTRPTWFMVKTHLKMNQSLAVVGSPSALRMIHAEKA